MLLLIDKPKGITSHDVVDEVRKITGERRVGHAGTLDPNATGLLIIGVGRESTKKLGKIAKDTKKIYETEIYLGEERDTHDAEGRRLGEPLARRGKILRQAQDDKSGAKSLPNLSSVEDVLEGFIGEQEQVPPVYSAIKIKGKKAYELARAGKYIKLKPRKIVIHSIELLTYKYPILRIKCQVSSGTYIRALARDVGTKLGCGAYLRNLRRTKIGKYDIKDAVKLDNLTNNNLSVN